MQTLKSLILKLDGSRIGCRCTAHHKYNFHILECAICSASTSCHGGNVQSSLKDNYRMSETLFFPGWEVGTSAKTDQFVSKAPKTFHRGIVRLRAATHLWVNAERDPLSIWLFPALFEGVWALLFWLMCALAGAVSRVLLFYSISI